MDILSVFRRMDKEKRSISNNRINRNHSSNSNNEDESGGNVGRFSCSADRAPAAKNHEEQMMKTTYAMFYVAMLILGGALAACDSGTPGATSPTNSAVPDATAEVGEKIEKAADQTGQVLSDSAITAKAKLALANAPDLKSMDISVDTVQGRVTLTGHVPSETDIQKAGVVVSGLEGVKSVENKLTVKSSA